MVDWSELEKTLEKAANDAGFWEDACNEIVEIMGASGMLFAPANPEFRGQWMSCSTALKQTLPEYIEGGWHLKDPREEVTALTLKNGYAWDDDIFPDREARYAMPFYRDFLCRHGFGVCLGVKVVTPNGIWCMFIHFANDHPGSSDAILEKVEKLRLMVEAAVGRANTLAHEQIAPFAQFFSGSESEVFILDGHANQILRMDNTGTLVNEVGVQSLWPSELGEQINQELTDLCSSNPELSLSASYTFADRTDKVTVLVVQAPHRLRHFFMPFKIVAIRTQCSDTMALKQARLDEEYRYTAAEVSTLELLAAGKSPNSIAELLGLKPTSIRQRLKEMYSKVGVSGQVELVAFYNGL